MNMINGRLQIPYDFNTTLERAVLVAQSFRQRWAKGELSRQIGSRVEFDLKERHSIRTIAATNFPPPM